MALRFTNSYLEDSLTLFRYYKKLGEGAMAQISDEQLFAVVADEMNSIAIMVNHMTSNMRSRWTDFLTTDGEKPGRNRDREFSESPVSREALMELWNQGWNCVFTALEPLSDAVMQAINRQMAHYAYHCGQIVFLAKQFRGREWKSLSIPRGQSASSNERVAKGEASQR
jgi:hypothetical protein